MSRKESSGIRYCITSKNSCIKTEVKKAQNPVLFSIKKDDHIYPTI